MTQGRTDGDAAAVRAGERSWSRCGAFGAVLVGFALTLLLSACASIDRLPAVPLALASEIKPLDVPYARFYADGDPAVFRALAYEMVSKGQAHRERTGANSKKVKPTNFLAISGGGDDGAFGAGLLVGWTARGDRPEFAVVTGISTGALSAPFAFLGPEYDEQLKRVYTETSPDMIYSTEPILAILSGDAITDTTPLKKLIASYVDDAMVRRFAEEYDKGRLLLIATTNLDQARSIIWNVGAIAKSTDPRARELIVEVLRASASIPGAFPPVMLDVTVDGNRYEEMHVDGGAMAQVFLYPPSLRLKTVDRVRPGHKDVAYIIRNGRLFRAETSVKRQTLAIAGQAISTMTAANAVNDLYRIYLTAQRDGVDFNLAYLEDEFTEPYKGPFDKTYMNKLFDYGYSKGAEGYAWRKLPPGYER
ncbi:patatin-like phospholipase family protein [Hyphomicrobium sp. CS1GBMeth3]|uniref:patatin-like phospholipase family protein n=1 Tax=Hyphomicrobium sp. CS1GBMeth3 TaxID=1892845 RepID=UPI0009FAF423|nr:patatin-like phospholipase family protein [Hyphomicrobium sp. CS1GBMeth3]